VAAPTSPDRFDTASAARADPTRRDIVARLAQGEATVQEIARAVPARQPAAACRHLRVPEEAGLIETRVSGTSRPPPLNPRAVAALWDWPGRYRALWGENHARLDAVLAEMEAVSLVVV
jgi:DNA-binding transcriptional ArsR family regulator